MAISLQIKGIDAAVNVIDRKIQSMTNEVQAELNDWALKTSTLAKQLAPTDEGHLKGSIGYKIEPLKVSITVNVDYAAYLEFGTRHFAAEYVAQLPGEWQSFSAQYKGGGGGSFQDMVIRIVEWVKRKGFDVHQYGGQEYDEESGNTIYRKSPSNNDTAAATDQAAYLIARSIVTKGIKPHPFLYPAVQATSPQLIKNIKAIIEK